MLYIVYENRKSCGLLILATNYENSASGILLLARKRENPWMGCLLFFKICTGDVLAFKVDLEIFQCLGNLLSVANWSIDWISYPFFQNCLRGFYFCSHTKEGDPITGVDQVEVTFSLNPSFSIERGMNLKGMGTKFSSSSN